MSSSFISQDGKTIKYRTNDLKNKNQISELTYTVVNNSKEYDANVSLNCNNPSDLITINNSLDKSVIKGKETAEGVLTVVLHNAMTDDYEIEFECTIDAEAQEREVVGVENLDEGVSKTFSVYGYLVDDKGNVLPEKTLAMYSDKPHYVVTDKRGYFYVSGLESGSHEIYYLKTKPIEEVEKLTKSEQKVQAETKADLTTSSKKIVFDNNYKVVKQVIERTTTKNIEVKFDSQGGSEISAKSVALNELYGTLEQPTRVGNTFAGWYYDNYQITGNMLVSVGETHTLVAQWIANKYILSFDSVGGSKVSDKDITFDSPYGELAAPIREGYTFNGWFTDTEYVIEIKSTDDVNDAENKIVFAKWTANNYSISYNGKVATACAAGTTSSAGASSCQASYSYYNTSSYSYSCRTFATSKMCGAYNYRNGHLYVCKADKTDCPPASDTTCQWIGSFHTLFRLASNYSC